MQTDTPANSAPYVPEYGTIQWLKSFLIFNQQPSLSLHPDYLPVYDKTGMWVKLLGRTKNKAFVHRHWSDQILNTIDIKSHITQADNSALLQIALHPPAILQQLIAWLGLQLCSHQIRNFIHKQQLGKLLEPPHYEFVKMAQVNQSAVIYQPANKWCSATIAEHYINLGYSALLHACQSVDPASGALLALKLPKLKKLSDLPDAENTFQMCLMFLQR